MMKVKEESEKSGLKFNILRIKIMASSPIQFSYSVVSDSLQPHELQHASLPVHHQLPEFTQTRVHQVSDAIQPSHPLSSPSPPAPDRKALLSSEPVAQATPASSSWLQGL